MAPFDLHSVELPEDGPFLEEIPEGVALGTYGTTSTLGTASCPVSSAGSVMTASSAG
ncbi:MAG: thiocillin family RiPP [Thermobispora bispora]|jgi:hypothetical protein|nr:thiocillin family RiPP [Thermobispora bispora]